MNDNLKRYFAILKPLQSLRSTQPKGNVACCHLRCYYSTGDVGWPYPK